MQTELTTKANLVLPWPPTINTYWRCVKNRVLLSKRGREYKRAVKTLSTQWPSFGDKRLSVLIVLMPATRHELDIDNRMKPMLDVLEENHVMNNDSQVDSLLVFRGPVMKPGKVIISIQTLETSIASH